MTKSVETLKKDIEEHFKYENGYLWWIKDSSPKGGTKVGTIAGSVYSDGYRAITFKGLRYKAHRLVWLYHYGVWPIKYLDHINGIRDDNRIENLREATAQQNTFNKSSLLGSSSKYKGVYWDKQNKNWRAMYTDNGKQKSIGSFKTEDEAAKAYDKVVRNLHKEFGVFNFG